MSISRHRILLLALLFVLFFPPPGSALAEGPSNQGPQTPNIVFILLDDLGYADLGSYGNGFIQTPNLDAMAQEGMRFTEYYAPASLCKPSRAGLISGHYPSKYGMRTSFGERGIPPYETNMAELLRAAGYATGHIGKWHLGTESDSVPINQGFDLDVRFRSALAGSPSYWDPLITIDDTQVVGHEGHLTEILTDYALDFIDAQQSSPFFLNLWYFAPHGPLEAPTDWASQYPPSNKGRFAALVSNVDEQIARILARLVDLGLDSNTLVFLASDNGGVDKWHGDDPSQEPSNGFKGAKRQVFEGGVRVPMIVRWPGTVAAGVTDNSPLIGIDVLPTIAELIGVDITGLEPPGESFLGLLLDSQPKLRSSSIFWEDKIEPQIFVSDLGLWNTFGVRRDDWKLVFEKDEYALYDLANDPEEAVNVADQNLATMSELLAEHSQWRLDNGLVPYTIDTIQGSVVVNDDTLDMTNGMVTLGQEVLFDIRDLDFSFAATLTPTEIGGARLIGTNRNTWRFFLLDNGRVKLLLTDQTGARTTLQSTTPLQVGQSYDVAFTIFSWDKSPAMARLYINQQLQAEEPILSTLMPSSEPIRIGNTPDLGRPFTGTIEGLELYTLNLTLEELALIFQ